MMNTKFQPHLRSFEEFDKLNYAAVTSGEPNTRNPFFPTLNPHTLDYHKLFNNFSTSESYLAFCDFAQMFVGSNQNLDPTSRQPIFYLIPDVATTMLLSNVFLPSSIFTEQFKIVYYKLIEASIWGRWEQQERKNFIRQEELQHLVLTFDDLISIWWVLAWGAALGGTALVLEIATFHRRDAVGKLIVIRQRIWEIMRRF